MSTNEMTKEQIAEYLKLKEQMQKVRERQRSTGERLRAKNAVIVRKAKEAGITVSEKEISEELARMESKR